MSHAERGAIGALNRLLVTDPADWTRAANASLSHPSNPERWTREAKAANPALSEEQAVRVGQLLRREHYRRLSRLGAEARRLAREARAELERAGLDDVASERG